MKIKVCHVLVNINHSLLLETKAKFLDKNKYEQSFVFLNAERPKKLAGRLAAMGIETTWIKYSTQKKDLPRVIFALTKHFRKLRPDIVHCHLVDACLAGLTAAYLSGVKTRIHTRHHGSECHKYHWHGVYYDRYINKLSTRIIVATSTVRDTLINLENVSPDKISLISYGYDFKEFESNEHEVNELKKKYELVGRYPVVGVISRFVHWKGVQYTIPAFAKLAREYPDAKLVLENSLGNYTPEIMTLLKQHLHENQYLLVKFTGNIFDLYKTFDIFAHVPINKDVEAFGQIYIESLYLGIPSVFTLSGVASEFVRDRENALVVPYCDSDAIYHAMKLIMSDDGLRKKVIQQGAKDVADRFGGKRHAALLDEFYSQALSNK